MKEIERRFLLKELPEECVNMTPYSIKQAYLLLGVYKHLRVRIIDDTKAFLAYKIILNDIERMEYEYEIPFQDGIEMYDSSVYKLEKNRYKLFYNDKSVDIDIYKNVDLRIVEIEYTEQNVSDSILDIPYYCGAEVTGLSKYSNIEIAKLK